MYKKIEDELFFFVFGISSEAERDKKIRVCINKAYRDMCRTIRYKYTIDEISKANLDPEKNKWKGDKEAFLVNIKNLINTNVEMLNDKYDVNIFDEWHENLINQMMGNGKNGKDIFNTDFTLGVGHSQKWVNMTLKYMYIMGILPKNIKEVMHIPIDSYILNAAKAGKGDKIYDSFDVKGLGIVSDIKTWSKIDDYKKYLGFQKSVRTECGNMMPIEWERLAWMAEATRRSVEEK